MTLKEFDKRYVKSRQGYTDTLTGKLIYCPYNIGFKITQDDCIESRDCSKCWNEAREYLRYRDRQ